MEMSDRKLAKAEMQRLSRLRDRLLRFSILGADQILRPRPRMPNSNTVSISNLRCF
jgi:ribosomal protein S6